MSLTVTRSAVTKICINTQYESLTLICFEAHSFLFLLFFSSAGSSLLWAQVIQLQPVEDDHEGADHFGHALCWQEHWQLHCPSGLTSLQPHVWVVYPVRFYLEELLSEKTPYLYTVEAPLKFSEVLIYSEYKTNWIISIIMELDGTVETVQLLKIHQERLIWLLLLNLSTSLNMRSVIFWRLRNIYKYSQLIK